MGGKRRGRPVITQERMYANTKVVMHSKECGPCMEWQGATKNGSGYGIIMMNGRHIMAHRLSYIFVNGPIPDGHVVLHRCDNPICINPAHLYTGTVYDSIQDAYNRPD